MRQSCSSAAAWCKTIVPARPKNPRTPQTTCKTDFCNKIGHKRTSRRVLPSRASLHWRALHISANGERACVEFSQVSDG